LSKTSRKVLASFKEYFNELEYQTLIGLNNYHVAKDEWPTWRELSDFMDEKPENIQPRLSELRDAQAVRTHDKKPCSKSDHNRKVNTFKLVQTV